MRDLRMKIAAFTIALGLGGLGGLCGQFQQDPAGDDRNTRPGDQGDPPDGSRQAAEGEGHASLTRCRGARSRERARLDGVEWRRLLGIEQQPACEHRHQRLLGSLQWG